MKLYAVTCEYDVGLNHEGNTGCYSSEENLYEALEAVDWSTADFNNYQEVIDEGLLFIDVIDG